MAMRGKVGGPIRECSARRRVARWRALEINISDRFAAAPVQEGEYGALRVRAMQNQSAARYCSGAIQDLAAAGFHALRRRLDVVDVEIVKPEGKRQRRRLGEHAADRFPSGGELLICPHHADMAIGFLPVK